MVALPQGELLTVNANDNPLIRDALGDGVHFKPLRLDLENGEWVVLATSRPARIPLHYHTGTVDAWTISGSWHYYEYADQPQTAGSYLYEPGSSVHTLVCPDSNTEDTVVLFRVSGANVNFTDDGQFRFHPRRGLDCTLTGLLAAEQNVGTVTYISGGAAGSTYVGA